MQTSYISVNLCYVLHTYILSLIVIIHMSTLIVYPCFIFKYVCTSVPEYAHTYIILLVKIQCIVGASLNINVS